MRRAIVFMSVLLSLSGCSYLHVHKMDIEQGNIVTPTEVHKIHRGMSETEVKNILGNPVLSNVFNENQLDYVYTYQPGYGELSEQYVTIRLQHGRVSEIKGNL